MLHEVTTAIFFNAFWDIVLSCARSGFIRKKEKEKKKHILSKVVQKTAVGVT